MGFSKVGPAAPVAPAEPTKTQAPALPVSTAPAIPVPTAPAAPTVAAAPAPAVENPAPPKRKRRTKATIEVDTSALDEIARLKAELAKLQANGTIPADTQEPAVAAPTPKAPQAPAPEVPAAPVPHQAPAAAPLPPMPDMPSAPEEEDSDRETPAPVPSVVPEASMLPHERAAAAPASLPARQKSSEVRTPFAGNSDAQIATSDLMVPKIHIVQQIGELARNFKSGEVVFNRQVCIYRPLTQGEQPQAINTPVQFVVLGFKDKLWVERKKGGNGQVAHSKEEVIAFGGALTFGEAEQTGKNWFQTLASAIIMIRKPEHLDDSLFPFAYGDSNWAIAQWSMKGGSYTNGARPIYSARKIGGLRKSWANHLWALTTRFQSYPNGHSAYVPQLQPGAFSPIEFKNWLADVLSGKDLDQAADNVDDE